MGLLEAARLRGPWGQCHSKGGWDRARLPRRRGPTPKLGFLPSTQADTARLHEVTQPPRGLGEAGRDKRASSPEAADSRAPIWWEL